MENYRPTRRSLFVRRRMSLLVRFQTDQDDLWRRSGALHSERQLRKSETRRTCHRGYGQSPEGQTMMESFGNWNFSYNYIDEKASPEQRKALEAIAAKVLTPGASKKTETRYVPINRKIEGKDHEITLGQYGTFRGHLVEGGMGGAPKIANPPGADPLHHEYSQGRTSKMTYTDADQNWAWENSNYMFGTFTVDNVQYEKFAAGLAQKMAKLKDEKAPEKK